MLSSSESAAEYLESKGFYRGIHFSLDFAEALADKVAFELAIRDKFIESSMEFFYFDGNQETCDNKCIWDGYSKRCVCDNRRVCWAKDNDFSYLNPKIHAEAW